MNKKHYNENYWTKQRIELEAWFQRNAPSLGELYEGALIILHTNNFPGRTRFLAHAVREIMNRLPDVIAGVKSSRIDYVNLLDNIVPHWNEAGFSEDGSVPQNITNGGQLESTDILIPRRLFRKISALVKIHVQGREKRFDKVTRLYEAIGPGNQPLGDSLRPIVIQWIGETDWFVGKAHDSGLQDNAVYEEELHTHFDLFERSLGAIIQEFFKTIEGLDEILEEANI